MVSLFIHDDLSRADAGVFTVSEVMAESLGLEHVLSQLSIVVPGVFHHISASTRSSPFSLQRLQRETSGCGCSVI